jgi:GNAT superfamily N-acetyltransferase
MDIRPLKAGDITELNTIVAFSMMSTWEGNLEARRDRKVVPGLSFTERKGLYGRTIGRPDFSVIVALDDNKDVRGSAIARVAKDSRDRLYGHWIDLYVEPDWRRHAVGMALLHATERFAAEQGATYVYSEIHAANHKALSCFHKAGYRITEPRQGRYWFHICMKRIAGSLPPEDEGR